MAATIGRLNPLVLLVCLGALAAPAAAQVGKCCLPDGRGCFNRTQAQCDAAGGVFIAGQTCIDENDTCDPPLNGACCPGGGGACTFGAASACSGQFFPSSPCSPTICTPPTTGACCENFNCRITIAVDCQSPGATFFANQGCSPGFCGTPPTGACCRGGACQVLERLECMSSGDGAEWYENQSCTTDLCRLGGCCSGSFSCVIVTEQGCEQGFFVLDGTCAPFFCISTLGSCCRPTGACVVTTSDDCTNGTYIDSGTCAPTTCAPATGACCTGVTCAITTMALCPGGSQFQGVGTACGAPGNPTTCCPANFNGVGGVTVQDIFDFLAAYFAADPAADFNGSGDTTVQDIFDFLAAYFSGCP